MEITVNNAGKSYLVSNSVLDTGAIVEALNADVDLIINTTEIGDGGFNLEADLGERGICKSILRVSTTGITFGDLGKNEAIQAIYDERKINDAGFGDYLKCKIINAIFVKNVGIEPLNEDGTVKAEFV